ncbi:4-(cytidine 5'-diphospho)-2-C-methyl-D-erythritol kinase [Alienimonas californiensis]|uniref:4-diphosphocytidyl-2-C-methyl-D-erythritol kinase n=1 Tax=Alienimonas californiensis TaxID=2527989 RepID=A0A517PCZ9_9PLAN|nr:4-(cytidine 5'-diphospho)-2-C-methyl-D-erythritol kinase [Alienimonas californiensis]QDT17257.1 4-diphosphocytidyl-2-C-methyl-D-erythritol kinase [Alienimonas californiensis]
MRTLRHCRRSNADPAAPALTIHAPAKLNLTLDVLGKRADGFHELESLMVTVGWYDTLTFAPAERFALAVTGAAGVPCDERNLVTRAATALSAAIGRDPGAAITLHKRIPHEAGLGGGSSDAAATLLGLNELWDCGLSRAELSELGATIGSDVPFFLCGSPAGVVRGRGERVEPLNPGPPRWAALAKPPIGLSTAAVFAAWGGRTSAQATSRAAGAYAAAGSALAAATTNDLDGPATELEPTLAAERDAFASLGFERSCLSGSGTSRFALCRSAASARSAAAALRRLRPGPVAAVPLAV